MTCPTDAMTASRRSPRSTPARSGASMQQPPLQRADHRDRLRAAAATAAPARRRARRDRPPARGRRAAGNRPRPCPRRARRARHGRVARALGRGVEVERELGQFLRDDRLVVARSRRRSAPRRRGAMRSPSRAAEVDHHPVGIARLRAHRRRWAQRRRCALGQLEQRRGLAQRAGDQRPPGFPTAGASSSASTAGDDLVAGRLDPDRARPPNRHIAPASSASTRRIAP